MEESSLLPIWGDALPEKGRRGAKRILDAFLDIGLGYLPLGQPSPTLSGGEAQRVKLARYLGRRSLSGQLLVLDEPSTGLHPQDVGGLLRVLDRLVRAGATVVVVEHNADLIRAADWIVDLGPGAGPDGGRLLCAGPQAELMASGASITARALREEDDVRPLDGTEKSVQRTSAIRIRGARAHNLGGVSVDIPKSALTVVTGVSGSGKSSLVVNVLEAEARRRFLESLSLYERQGTREGPEAPVESVRGLGVSVAVQPGRHRFNRRSTVGSETELSHHLAVLLSRIGTRDCLRCGVGMVRREEWVCPGCGERARIGAPRHFSPATYAAACTACHGVGTVQEPNPDKLIIHPDRPLCAGAMYSPGFFPKGYLGKPYNGGYYLMQALGGRYGFDPHETPWNRMSAEAQQAFLFGDSEPLEVHFENRKGKRHTRQGRFPGFYGWVRDWDVGGTYTDAVACTECSGVRLRADYASVNLGGHNMHGLGEMPLWELCDLIQDISLPQDEMRLSGASLETALRRLRFLLQVGVGYLHLNRVSGTLSAGEAQRIKLAGLLGSGLTSLTVLVDEPTRGLHPSEVSALTEALLGLRDEGNCVVVVEHDPVLIREADHLIDMGPGAGTAGGEIVASGTPQDVAAADTVTARWLGGRRQVDLHLPRREPRDWLTVRGARANNLRGEAVPLPLGALVGLCGVSGSGKSTLLIDTLGRVLAPKKQTTSVAREPVDPGAHDAVSGAPPRTVIVDQARTGIRNPASFLGLMQPLRGLYAAGEDAQALGMDEKALSRPCSACSGSGILRMDMGFLPGVQTPCETCRGTGHRPEAWEVRLRGVALPEVYGLTIDEVYALFGEEKKVRRALISMREVGLGYLTFRQPGYALSGGEAQRLKIAKELCRKASDGTLYILDEPTVGQHLEDVARLTGVLHRLVDDGHSVFVVEHHAHLLATCDWLVELGPGGGPDGGRVIGSGTPESLTRGDTPIAPYLREILTPSEDSQ